jgi:hypothetical protein
MESIAIHQGIPAVTGFLGNAAGGPVGGFAGAVVGSQIANLVGNKVGAGIKTHRRGVRRYSSGTDEMKEKMRKVREGKGLGKNLKTAARHAISYAKTFAKKKAADHVIDGISSIANAYGYPVPSAVTTTMKLAADHYIDGRHQAAIHAIKTPAKQLMKEQIQKQVDALPIEAQPYVQQKVVSLGFGMKQKHERVMRGGTLKVVRKSKKLYKNDDYTHDRHEDHVEATFSPYLNSSNPAMNPYIPLVNSYTHAIKSGKGLYNNVRIKDGSGLFGPVGGSGLY